MACGSCGSASKTKTRSITPFKRQTKHKEPVKSITKLPKSATASKRLWT